MPGLAHRYGKLVWRNVGDASWPEFLHDLPKRIGTRDIWVTVDKDVLSTDEAVTNWDQGEMTMAHVTEVFRTLADRFHIAGIDVCGDYSRPAFRDPYRLALAALDIADRRRQQPTAAAVNAQANARLLALFDQVVP